MTPIKRITLSLQSRLSACLTLVIGVEKAFPDQKSSVPNRKMRNRVDSRGKRVQPESLPKKDGDRACHLQNEKVQANGRHIQKQSQKA